jgi:hypothetical protein
MQSFWPRGFFIAFIEMGLPTQIIMADCVTDRRFAKFPAFINREGPIQKAISCGSSHAKTH